MPTFGTRSLAKLDTVHPDLIMVAQEVVRIVDIAIIWGHRNKQAQEKAYQSGKSKLQWPKSKHNKFPSLALDFVPYPIDWDDEDRFIYVAGIFMHVGITLGVKLRWGGDWARDFMVTKHHPRDLDHIELWGY